MSHDASHAKDVARAELVKLQSLVTEERKAREKARQDIVLEAKGDLSTEAEEKLKKNLVANALHHSLNQNVMEGEQQVMSAYEQAFRKIKEATGVGDVNEGIQKFLTQKDTEKQLMNATKEAQAKIEALAEERNVMKHQVDEM